MYLFSNVMSLDKMVCFICVILQSVFSEKKNCLMGKQVRLLSGTKLCFYLTRPGTKYYSLWFQTTVNNLPNSVNHWIVIGKLNCFRCNFSITCVAIFFHVSAIVASPYTMTNHLEEVIMMTHTPVSSASVIIMPTVVFIIKLWTPALTHVPRGEEVCV